MKSILSILVFLFFVASNANAQTFPYGFTVLNDPYYDLSEPISISNAEVWDDPFYITSTGFQFPLFETITNTLGIISPGSQVVNLNEAAPDTVELLAPYFSDIMTANDSDAVSPISYQLEGPPGNQIFKLEWKNVGFYGEFQASNTFFNTTNFQLWLYQNSGVIEFRYGPNTIKSGGLIHYFGTGPLVLLGNNVSFDGSGWAGLWALGGDPENPQITAIPSGTQPLDTQCLSEEPPSGTVYRFAPIAINKAELAYDVQMSVWPSPAIENIHLSIKPNREYRIYDIAGKLMLTKQSTYAHELLDISNWPSGPYYIMCDGAKTVRFTKY